jgi:uncharacterized glyoxalase superfamily protein PhnB
MSDTPAAAGGVSRGQPETFRARSLTASLTVNDIQHSIGFYRDLLGFHVARLHEREGKLLAASLQAGSIQLLLSQDDGSKGTDRMKGIGFSLQFTTAQDIDAMAARIKERGGKLASEPADAWGARVFRLRDPDGFLLVVSSER